MSAGEHRLWKGSGTHPQESPTVVGSFGLLLQYAILDGVGHCQRSGCPILGDKIWKHAGDLTPTAETEMIKAYVRVLAPEIHDVSCGARMDGGYDLWLQLNPTST